MKESSLNPAVSEAFWFVGRGGWTYMAFGAWTASPKLHFMRVKRGPGIQCGPKRPGPQHAWEKESLMTADTKEQLLEELDQNHQQVLKYKGKLFTIFYDHQIYSSEETCGFQYQPGDKVYCQRIGRPKKLVGTAIDHNTLSREQLLEAID
jgi:hypothetical protein